MDGRDTAVLAVAAIADQGEDVEAERMRRQCVVALGLGTVGLRLAWALRVRTASDVPSEAEPSGEGGGAASVLVVGPEALSAGGAMGKPGLEVFAACGLRWCCRPGQSALRGCGSVNPNPGPASPSSQLCHPRKKLDFPTSGFCVIASDFL